MSKIPDTETLAVANTAVALDILDRVMVMKRNAVSIGDAQEVTRRLTNLYIKIYAAVNRRQPIKK